MKTFAKAWAALVAGLVVVLGAGLITGSAAVWISTGIAAGGAVLAVLVGPANATKTALAARAARDASPAAAPPPAPAVPVVTVHVHGTGAPPSVHTSTSAQSAELTSEPPPAANPARELRGGGH